MDIYAKSQQLLETLANAIIDRNPDSPVFFTTQESHVVEKFLRDFLRDVKKEIGDY